MAPSSSSLLARLFAVVVVVVILTEAAVEAAQNSMDVDLIASACNHTLYYDVCVSSLASHASSRAADLRGLAAISLAVGTAHAKATISYARSLSKQQKGGFGADAAYVAGCLSDCLEEYGDAVASLHESAAALRRGSYERVKELVSGAMTNSDTCEGAFADKTGLQSPLTERNDYFFKLCSNSIAITTLLV